MGFVFRNMKLLIFPYLIFAFISILWGYFSFFIKGVEYPESYFIKSIYGIILGVGFDTKYTIFNNAPLWFLPAMFLLRIIFGIISNLSEYVIILIGITMLGLVVLLHEYNLFLPLSLGSTMFAFPFFYFGRLSRKLGIIEKLNNNKLLFFIMSVVLWVVSLYNNIGMVDINHIEYQNMLFTLLGGIFGTVMIFVISLCLESKHCSFILRISNGTLLIMSLHLICMAIVYKIFIELGGVLKEYLNTIILGLLLSLVVITIFYYPILFCEKYCPILLGKNKK